MTHRSRAQDGDPLHILAHAAGYATFAAGPGAAPAAKPLLESLVCAWATRAYSGAGGLRVVELHDVREDAQADVPLLLMCAEDNEVSLVHLVDVLNRSGRAPEVIAGVEHDPTLLSLATDRTRGAALFVLCQSSELDRTQVLRLSGLFSARKGPLHELLVVDVDGSASLDALPLIEAAMESVSRGSSASVEASAARAARVPKRDVVVLPGDSAAPGAIPNYDDEDAGARQLRLGRETAQAPAADVVEADTAAADALEPAAEDAAELDAEEREARDVAEREARDAAEREARAAAEREARELAEREARAAAEREARELAEREARELAKREARELVEREAVEIAKQQARDAAEREAREEAEELARALHEEMLATEAMLERRSSRRNTSRGSEAKSPSRGGLGDGVPVALEPDQAETRPLGINEASPLKADSLPDPVAPPGDDSLPERAGEDEERGLLSTSLSGVRVADPLASVPIPDTIQTELTPTDTRRRRREPEQTDTHEAARTHEAGESRVGWLLAIAGAAALGGLALFVMRGGSTTEDSGQRSASVAATHAGGTKAAASSAGHPSPTSAKASAQAKPDAKVEPQAKPDAKVEPQAKPEVKVEPQAKPEAKVEPQAKPGPGAKVEPAAKPQANVEPLPAPKAAPDPTPEPEDAPGGQSAVSSIPPAPSDSEALRVDLAVRSGTIRALDTLLIARSGTGEVDWGQAKTACRRKRVAGLPGWRLPSRRQLERLRRSRLIRSGTYWSRDRGRHDDDAFAVDAESGESHVYLTVEPAARVQCVRKR